MSTSPYRQAAVVVRETPPSEFACARTNWQPRPSRTAEVIKLAAFPIILGLLFAVLLGPWDGAVLALCFSGAVFFEHVRAGYGETARLTVIGGELRVHGGRTHFAWHRVALDQLADVSLEPRPQQRIEADPTVLVPDHDPIPTRVPRDGDLARVVLVHEDGTHVPLEETYAAHMEAMDLLGKIRLFLRKNGWVPEDERDEPDHGALPEM